MPEYQDTHISLLQGDALSVLKTMPDESVDMCMTSPPYWGLRDYHADGQIGLEKTFQEYIDHLMQIFDEVKRVIKKTGTCWVNIADSYAGGGTHHGDKNTGISKSSTRQSGEWENKPVGIPAKSLIGIPERFALAMTDQLGFIRRNTIIWWKRNPMPESVKDRFTEDFEYLYMFSKQGKYFFEQQFDKQTESTIERARYGWAGRTDDGSNGARTGSSFKRMAETGELIATIPTNGLRNARCVWDIPTESGKSDHYAAYPEKLCETPILAGCPAAICTKCGKAREKIYETENMVIKRTDWGASAGNRTASSGTMVSPAKREDIGYTDCGCGASFDPGVVLDPFAGTGTTGAVSKRLGRKAVLIELSPKYCQIIKKRMQYISIPMKVNIA
jgi:DNA modification methylase